jgi:hypothetical protein
VLQEPNVAAEEDVLKATWFRNCDWVHDPSATADSLSMFAFQTPSGADTSPVSGQRLPIDPGGCESFERHDAVVRTLRYSLRADLPEPYGFNPLVDRLRMGWS